MCLFHIRIFRLANSGDPINLKPHSAVSHSDRDMMCIPCILDMLCIRDILCILDMQCSAYPDQSETLQNVVRVALSHCIYL